MRIKDFFKRKKKQEPAAKPAPAPIDYVFPYKDGVEDWYDPVEVWFFVPSEDVEELVNDESYIETVQSKYLTSYRSWFGSCPHVLRTRFYGCSNGAWLEEFRFYIRYDDWFEFESLSCVQALKQYLVRLQTRRKSSGHHEAEDLRENVQSEV